MPHQPALEELLALYEDGVVDPEQQKTFVVAVRDCEDGMEAELEKAVGQRLQAVWAAAVKPEVRTKYSGRRWKYSGRRPSCDEEKHTE